MWVTMQKELGHRTVDPEVLISTPCGFHLDKVNEQVSKCFEYPGWRDLSAVHEGQVYAVDASSYFARPGPRVIDGTELFSDRITVKLWSSSFTTTGKKSWFPGHGI